VNGATDKLKTCRHGGQRASRAAMGRQPEFPCLRCGLGWRAGLDGERTGLDGRGRPAPIKAPGGSRGIANRQKTGGTRAR